MNKTVVGVFHDFSEAQKVVQELIRQGVSRDDISLMALAGGQQGATRESLTTAGLSGPSMLSVPEIGDLIAAGPLAAAVADTGEGKNAIESAFASLGVSAERARSYTRVLRGGSVLVAVKASDEQLEHFSHTLSQFRTVDIDQGKQSEGEVVLPVMQEELKVGKREVQRGGVRVYTHVTETPVKETVNLREEHVIVERHPVNRAVSQADTTAFKEGSFEMRQSAEEVVVSKQARVIEEVVIGKKITERAETVRDTVKRTDVQVEQLSAQGPQGGRVAADEGDFRKNYDTAFAQSGYSYDQVAPAYRFGQSLRTHEDYRDQDWSKVETEAKTHWEEKNPGTWDRFKEAVQYAWDKTKAAVS